MTAARVWSALKAIVTAGLLGGLLYQFGAGQILATLRKADSVGIVAMLGLSVLMILTLAFRWHLLLRPLAGPACRFREVTAATFSGYYASYFLPSVGGDAVRVSCLIKPGRQAGALALSVLVDRCLGLLALLALGAIGVGLHGSAGERAGLVWGIYVSATAVVVVMLALCHGTGPVARRLERLPGGWAKRLTPLIRGIGQAADVYVTRKAMLVQTLGLAILSQVMSVSIYYGIARTVGVHGRLLDFLYAVPVVNLAIVMPISIGGIGVGEWTFVYIFTDLGMSREAAFSISLLNLLARLAAGLIGLAFCGLARRP